MTKLYRQPIEVRINNDGLPAAFYWRRRWYHITNCTVKKDLPSRLQWWKKAGPPLYRCETKQGMFCDLIKREDIWLLERVWD